MKKIRTFALPNTKQEYKSIQEYKSTTFFEDNEATTTT